MKTYPDPSISSNIDPEAIAQIDAYWRAANYLSVGQIYLYNNPLLKQPLELSHVKPRLLGHWGTTPGLNFIYAHLNRIIVQHDQNMIYVTGPGHGGPGLAANVYLEGTYSEYYPEISENESGLQKLFKQFSFPGGIPSHVAPDIPGSINEGGELGYCLVHAFGAAFDNPDLIVACVVGDGEAESGPLAASWHSNKFLNPETDGAVLPILHLNGYKIANPTLLSRIPAHELEQLLRGYGYNPYVVEGDDPSTMHALMAKTLDTVFAEIKDIQNSARQEGYQQRPTWPMIVLRSPKGWTGPGLVDGVQIEGTWRAHQVPLDKLAEQPEHLKLLEQWMKTYRPEELFDQSGKLIAALAALAPKGTRRMGANPHGNGGMLLQDLVMPDFRDYALPARISGRVSPTAQPDRLARAQVFTPGEIEASATSIMGEFLRDVIKMNPKNFRLFGPDETNSNRLSKVYEATNKVWTAETLSSDEHLSPSGRVMEILSEHLCQGWLEGYLLTGRHGLFSCYEAFIHIVDSMVNQYAKWLDACKEIKWRKPVASLNYLLTSHVWRQDHNGNSHQDPGFLDHVSNKSPDIIRVYLPPDTNTLLSVTDHCLRSKNYINVIVAGKQPEPQWLDIEAASSHCSAGLGIWQWASNDEGKEPDMVMACAGDVPTLETMAAVMLLREKLPSLKVRVINVVDLMKLQPEKSHPHGLSDTAFDQLFTKNKPVIFAFHGYPMLIHRLTYNRTNHQQFHVQGYQGEGTTTTPFDMLVMNKLDRFHLALSAIKRMLKEDPNAEEVKKWLNDKLVEHKHYVQWHGDDLPEIRNWKWKSE